MLIFFLLITDIDIIFFLITYIDIFLQINEIMIILLIKYFFD